jgi:DNA-binding PadR family transcriptional regulator
MRHIQSFQYAILKTFNIISRWSYNAKSMNKKDIPSVAHTDTEMNTLDTPNSANGHTESDDITSRNGLRYIILGLLWTHPMTGYDIKRAFDRALASYWNAGNSQIYTTLKHLSHAGLVESEIIVQTTRPNRKVYRLTETGERELERWLHEDGPDRFNKDDFLAKLFFCGETTDEVTLHHLHEHRETLLKQLAHMEWARQQYATRPSRRPRLLEYQMLVREYREATLRADLEVTERAIARLEAKPS